jgi:RHS repeat-associated protein
MICSSVSRAFFIVRPLHGPDSNRRWRKNPVAGQTLAANANCAALPVTAVATVYFGAVEVRNWQVPGQEVVLTYPSPAVKLTNGVAGYLHRDHLGPNRAITDAAGARVESAVYKPFGEQTEFVTPGLAAPESKGWIGERYDEGGGLQYLNARYYDPVLGMFLQPDWWEVLKPGVGTNRFSYSFNDPVNKLDPLGNFSIGTGPGGGPGGNPQRRGGDGSIGRAIGNFFERVASAFLVIGKAETRCISTMLVQRWVLPEGCFNKVTT